CEYGAEEFTAVRIVFHDQQPATVAGRSRHGWRVRLFDGGREGQPDESTHAGAGVESGHPVVASHDPEHLRQTEARTASALRCEERIEGLIRHLWWHSDSIVLNLDDCAVTAEVCAHCEHAALLHRIECVVDEVEQCFADLACNCADPDIRHEFAVQAHPSTAGPLGPERACHCDYLVGDYGQVHESMLGVLERFLPEEASNSSGSGCTGFRGGCDPRRVVADHGRIVRVEIEEVGGRDDGVERVVDVVHNACR